jgi:hypothetical protein
LYFDEDFMEIKENKIDINKIKPFRLATNPEKDRLYIADELFYKIVVTNENFEILISWTAKDYDKNYSITGLCFENNQLYVTDTNFCQIKVYKVYDEIKKYPDFNNQALIVQINDYNPIGIKVQSVNIEETMICVMCLKCEDVKNKGNYYDYKPNFYLHIYNHKKEICNLIANLEIKYFNHFIFNPLQHFFFYHSKFYQICFETKKLILYQDFGKIKVEIIELQEIFKDNIDLDMTDLYYQKNELVLTNFQDGLVLFFRIRCDDGIYEKTFLKILP